jgi:cell division protein FtsI/penicillin-binding protein 2
MSFFSLKQFYVALLALVLMAGCTTPPSPTPEPVLEPTTTPTLPEPQRQVTSAPDAEGAARAFLDAWVADDYDAMYAMLSSASQSRIDQEAFSKYYRDNAAEAAMDWLSYELYQPVTNPYNAKAGFEAIIHSALVGEIHRANELELTLEDGRWRVVWNDGLFMPELKGGNLLHMLYEIPERAEIYDSSGRTLAGQGEAVAVGIRTGLIDREVLTAMLEAIRTATGIRAETLLPRIEASQGGDWYIPVTDLPAQSLAPYASSLARYEAIRINYFTARYYFYGPATAHVVGYSSQIFAEEAEDYKRLGYNVFSSRVGRSGIELWGERYLAGKRGGTLRVLTPANELLAVVGQEPSEPAQNIQLTIDANLQVQIQRALGNMTGAIVVLERDTGAVLAMASSPGYNPNLFVTDNVNSTSETLNEIFDPLTRPRQNRAAEAQYPLGSVFKIITMAAALESGVYTAESEYECGYFFDELGDGIRLYDWTYERFLEDERTPPSGLLTLPQGLMRSCNIWFYKIGMEMYDRGMGSQISEMGRGFGLGSLTGIEITEATGQMPDPTERMDGTNIAIGQGNVLVTPLQVAAFVSAVGNGGTLYQPQLVEQITQPNGAVTHSFSPIVSGQLPVSPENLEIIQDAMYTVVTNSRGTANHVLGAFSRGYGVLIAAKTGTAESGIGLPHSWFAGYTNAGRANSPDIAVAVLVENIGEGSEFAAPIFKRVMEIYFTGAPRSIYPWEVQIGVIRTPTPTPTPTPLEAEMTPTPTPTPEEGLEETPEP